MHSIRTRLAVSFFLVSALSVAVLYAVVIPALTTGLQNQRITELKQLVTNKPEERIVSQIRALRRTPVVSDREAARALDLTRQLNDITVSQVTLVDFQVNPTGTSPIIFSTIAGWPDQQDNSTIEGWATLVQPSSPGSPPAPPQTATLGDLGVVGLSIGCCSPTRVLVFSVRLNDVAGAVSLVRSRMLLAAAIALLVVLLVGVLVARALTVRVLRLERTAQRVAQGDFGAHFGDDSGDELGQLARALAHMQSQLEGLDSARRRFIATASHELRTPIFSLGGFLELIQDEALDEDTRRQFVGQVRAQVDRLGKLATQLLDLTRLESGAVELASTITDLGVLARAVSTEFLPALTQHGSHLSLTLPERPIRVACDPERVAQLLRILVDNALAHTPAGTEVRVVATPPQRDDGPALSVTDSGPGVPPDALERVFEPFYSADGARGAGLGLAIARELAVHMGARLELASIPGETTFTLTLAAGEL